MVRAPIFLGHKICVIQSSTLSNEIALRIGLTLLCYNFNVQVRMIGEETDFIVMFAVDFRNRRPDFISNFFGLINWDKVAERFGA